MSHRTDASFVVAETVRAACLNAARLAYEDAGIRGLCVDGRWEAALTAMRQLDLSGLLDVQAALPSSTEAASQIDLVISGVKSPVSIARATGASGAITR